MIVVAALVWIVLLASTGASKAVLEDQKRVDIYSSTVTTGLYTVLNLRYADAETARCGVAESYQRPVTMTMRFRTTTVPDSCIIFVNGAIVQSLRRIEPDPRDPVTSTEFDRQLSMGLFDYRDTHRIRICCQDICVERTLEPLC